jgi:hypothetical protein
MYQIAVDIPREKVVVISGHKPGIRHVYEGITRVFTSSSATELILVQGHPDTVTRFIRVNIDDIRLLTIREKLESER